MLEEQTNHAKQFVREVAQELQLSHDEKAALRIMTAVFHTLRNLLTVQESLHLISQLPLYLKGIYVDKWHLGDQKKIRDRDEFIECLLLQNTKTAPHDFANDEIAIHHVKSVFRVLRRHISRGEIDDIIAQLPGDLKDLWAEEAVINPS